MYGIDLLVKEHKNIICFTELLNKRCCELISGREVEIATFREYIDFARNYADKHHHGKEEKILFLLMLEELGTLAEKLIQNGMLVEHDLGRYHMGELEKALDQYEVEKSIEGKLAIITHAAGYADLLRRHIEKEDEAVYTFAMRALDEKTKRKIDERTGTFEEEAERERIQDKYIFWLKKQMMRKKE